MTTTVRQKIVFELQQEDVASAETLWARQLDSDLFELLNIPALAYGVNLGDVVRAKKREDGRYYFEDVVRTGGHRTFRVAANEKASRRVAALRGLVRSSGGQIERSSEHYLAIDVPTGCPLAEILANLRRGEQAGDWEFEESGELSES